MAWRQIWKNDTMSTPLSRRLRRRVVFSKSIYCQIHCSVCNIPHKCKDIDCKETLAKANKMFYE